MQLPLFTGYTILLATVKIQYFNCEMAVMDMLHFNANKSRRLYDETFPNRRVPDNKTLQKMYEHLVVLWKDK